MRKKLAIVAAVVALPVVTVLGLAATKPATFTIERSTTIQAPPERVFALINDFHAWTGWSPYEKLDPALKRTYSGAASGPGAVYTWKGNGHAGAGSMEILEAPAPQHVTIKLSFTEPFQATNTTVFTLTPAGGETRVSWAMRGENAFVGKIMQVFFNMDEMLGKDFEAGLAAMKALAEKTP